MKSYKIVSDTWKHGSEPTLTAYLPPNDISQLFPIKISPFTEMIYPVYGMCLRHVWQFCTKFQPPVIIRGDIMTTGTRPQFREI